MDTPEEVLVVIGVGGMGEAIARRVGSGRSILLADKNQVLLNDVFESLSNDGYDVTTSRVDVASQEDLHRLATDAATLGSVRYVVHTSGLSPAQADAASIIAVNLSGVAYSLEEFGRIIAPGGAGVYISSMAGTMMMGQLSPGIEFSLATTPSSELHALPLFTTSPLTPSSAYGLAKRANQLRVQAASLAWGARGARVNSISPGLILTPMGQQELAGASGDLIRTMIHDAPISRVGTAGEIANVAAFLLSPDASYLTGTDILVDGGVIASIHRDRASLITATAPMVPAS